MTYNVRDFGAMGDGIADDSAAVQNALAALAALDPVSSRGDTLLFPFGRYRLSQTIHLRRGTIVQGVSGSGWFAGTVLAFDPGITGFVIDRATTSTDGGSGDWSSIADLAIVAAAKSGAADGVLMNARAHLRNLWINGFARSGVRIVGDANSNPATNANGWRLDYLRIDDCGGDGVFVDGGDSNAGLATAVDASNNGGWGIFDSSFLGNTWIGCHTSGNVGGSYKTDGATAYNVFVGCYAEGGQPAAQLALATLVLGGSLAGATDYPGPNTRAGLIDAAYGVRIRNGLSISGGGASNTGLVLGGPSPSIDFQGVGQKRLILRTDALGLQINDITGQSRIVFLRNAGGVIEFEVDDQGMLWMKDGSALRKTATSLADPQGHLPAGTRTVTAL